MIASGYLYADFGTLLATQREFVVYCPWCHLLFLIYFRIASFLLSYYSINRLLSPFNYGGDCGLSQTVVFENSRDSTLSPVRSLRVRPRIFEQI